MLALDPLTSQILCSCNDKVWSKEEKFTEYRRRFEQYILKSYKKLPLSCCKFLYQHQYQLCTNDVKANCTPQKLSNHNFYQFNFNVNQICEWDVNVLIMFLCLQTCIKMDKIICWINNMVIFPTFMDNISILTNKILSNNEGNINIVVTHCNTVSRLIKNPTNKLMPPISCDMINRLVQHSINNISTHSNALIKFIISKFCKPFIIKTFTMNSISSKINLIKQNPKFSTNLALIEYFENPQNYDTNQVIDIFWKCGIVHNTKSSPKLCELGIQMLGMTVFHHTIQAINYESNNNDSKHDIAIHTDEVKHQQHDQVDISDVILSVKSINNLNNAIIFLIILIVQLFF